MTKIVLSMREPGMNPNSDELASVIIDRLGLSPRKEGSTDKMHKTLLELYERQKRANREKKPELAVLTVEEMAILAGITRQTMYDYLKRWLDLNLISKTSFIQGSKVVIGYKLNGQTLEAAFEKAVSRIHGHLDDSKKFVQELQRIIKNEKIKAAQGKNTYSEELDEKTPENEVIQ